MSSMKGALNLHALAALLLCPGEADANGYQGYIKSLDSALQERIQERLIEEGYTLGAVDGMFGPQSNEALMRFRKDNNIMEDYPELDSILTPTLARALLGIDIEPGYNGEELDPREQLEVLRGLGLVPSADYWSKLGVILP